MINIKSIDHIVLRTTNIESMKKFYCDILGCTIEREQPKHNLIQLRFGANLIDLIEDKNYEPGKLGNLAHFCLRIAETDFAKLEQDMLLQGIKLRDQGERRNAKGVGYTCYLTDPEGNEVELALGD